MDEFELFGLGEMGREVICKSGRGGLCVADIYGTGVTDRVGDAYHPASVRL